MVTVKDAEAELPCASVALHVTVVGFPFAGKLVPDAGLQLTGTEPSRLSVAVALYVMALPPGSVVESLMFAGTVTTGSVVSVTVTVTVNDAEDELLCASVAEHVTVVVPALKLLPEVGEQLVPTDPSTTSLADGPVQGTAAGGESVDTDWLPGMPLRVGAVVSWTVTSNAAETGFPSASVPVQLTGVVPIRKRDPDAGSQVIPPSSKATFAPPGPVASTGPTGSPKALTRADASGVPANTSNTQTAIRPLTLIL
jgi:hypothetical protein